jgi:hypothetical protein
MMSNHHKKLQNNIKQYMEQTLEQSLHETTITRALGCRLRTAQFLFVCVDFRHANGSAGGCRRAGHRRRRRIQGRNNNNHFTVVRRAIRRADVIR